MYAVNNYISMTQLRRKANISCDLYLIKLSFMWNDDFPCFEKDSYKEFKCSVVYIFHKGIIVLCGYEVQMNMYFLILTRKSIFNCRVERSILLALL